MLKPIPHYEYEKKSERVLKAYEEAGLSANQCLSDMTDYKARYAADDGYADGLLVGGISLLVAGLICKALAHKELKQMNDQVNAKLRYAASVKPLTDFKVPGSDADDADREENN